jgi:Beta-lactamase
MAKFIFALFNGQLIDASLLERMDGRQPVLAIKTDRPRVAAGVFSYDTSLGEAFGHSGLWFGYKTLVVYYPALKVGAAMQVNSQINAAGADLQTFKIDDHDFSMIGALTLLVQKSLNKNVGTQ